MKQKIIIFKGQPIKTIKSKGEVYVSLAHLCRGVGVCMVGQSAKVKGNPALYLTKVIMGQRTTGERCKRMIMLPLNRVNTWLLSISPNRCKPMVRSTILHYQKECADALYDYWHKGKAINPRKESKNEEKNNIPIKSKAEVRGVLESVVRQNEELIKMNREIISYLSNNNSK